MNMTKPQPEMKILPDIIEDTQYDYLKTTQFHILYKLEKMHKRDVLLETR